ncbi:MAG: Mut7-C RNAse domain-containing protein [Candidatus ainarchaeum sp.]|nr:Mut7-C RNAse domain-containing protein [Candidatus ainarchaeum sp.]
MAILLDEMLKRTASWCRVLGIDTQFITGKSDTWLLQYAKKGKLVLVTKDMELFGRCQKQGVQCIFLKTDSREEQVAQIIRDTGVRMTFPERTRCPKCNGELAVVDAASVKDDVPETVADAQQRFWKCASCGKVYWEGSHWRNITRVYERVRALLELPQGGTETKDI